MRICHIISGDLWAGAEVQSTSLIRATNEMDNVLVCVICFNYGILEKRIRKEGIRIEIIDEKKLSLIGMILPIISLLRENRIEIVHTHGIKENFVGGIAAKLNGTTAVVRTHHGRGMLGGKRRYRLIEWLNRCVLTHKFISVSYELNEFLMKRGFNPKKINVIHNGINLTNKNIRAIANEKKTHLGINSDQFVLGTVGRLVPVKGHKYFLKAAKYILNSEQSAVFLVIGDGPLIEELGRLSERLGISDQVTFTGFKEDAAEIISIFDIFVLPSLHEGSPMVLLEAMALGKPIVATKTGGVPEILEDGNCGLLVSPGDSKELAEACISLIRNPDLRGLFCGNSLKTVANDFTLRRTLEKTIRLYEKLL